MRSRRRATVAAAMFLAACMFSASSMAQLPAPEVPVLSGPASGATLSGSNGIVLFSAIMNQPPPGGKVRQYTDYYEVCISRPGVACGTGDSEVCKFDTPLGKHGVRYFAQAPIKIPPEFSGQTVHWTMRAWSRTNNTVSAWAPIRSLTYTWTPKPATLPARCRPVGSGSGGGNPGGGNNESHTFGWETPINQNAVTAFSLPAGALGKNLAQIVTQRGNSIRADGKACVECHNLGTATANTRLDNLMGKQDFINRNYVNRFITGPNNKPQNLKNFFQNWKDRGHPD